MESILEKASAEARIVQRSSRNFLTRYLQVSLLVSGRSG
jgi:hypothetical protein